MSRKSTRGVGLQPGLALLLLLTISCSHAPRGIQRIAVFPLENLSGDDALSWTGRAASEILVLSLTGLPAVHPLRAGAPSDVWDSRSDCTLRGYFTAAGGRLHLTAQLDGVASRRTLKVVTAEGPLSAGILPLAAGLARQIDPRAEAPPIRASAALKAYVEGLQSADPAAAAVLFARAVSADPDLGAAYVAWAQVLFARGDRAAASKVIEQAMLRGDALAAAERGKLALQAASLQPDPAARSRALSELATRIPADSDLAREAGDAATLDHAYPAAVQWFERATGLEPGNPILWNQLGYAKAYVRDLAGARHALQRYQTLSPQNANVPDSLGDVHFYLGRFAQAEKFYLDAYSKDAAFLGGGSLLKAAHARLMTGDVTGAGAIARKYLEPRAAAADPAAGVNQAQWDYLCGRRTQAMAALERLASPHLRVLAQLTIWKLQAGDTQSARAFAQQAARLASPPDRELAALCLFLTQPAASASQWALRAETAFAHPSQAALQRFALAYALLFSKDFQQAALVVKELHRRASPTSVDPMNVLYAWALVGSGRFKEARELLDVYAIPQPAGESLFAALSFPRQFYLRALVLDREGKREEARAGYALFLKLSGDLPMAFGEEQAARAALSR